MPLLLSELWATRIEGELRLKIMEAIGLIGALIYLIGPREATCVLGVYSYASLW